MKDTEKVKRKQDEIRRFFVILVGNCENEECLMEEAQDTGDYFDMILLMIEIN